MLKTSKLYLPIFFFLLLIFAVAPKCYGNSAEPPSILIIVTNAPEDLEISIKEGNTYIKANRIDNIIENYYTFYLRDLKNIDDYCININYGNRTFGILLDKPVKSYNNIYTLDLDNRTLVPGKLLSRSILLVSIRIILTILIEAFIFWLLGFWSKESWVAFLIINLITQGALNIWLNGFAPLASYIVVNLILGEILVFAFEAIVFLIFIKEHSRVRTFIYVITANLLSLFAGGYIITVLPV